MRLANRMDSCAFDGDEHAAWEHGLEVGRRLGRPEPSRSDVERLLDRLGLDTSNEAMAKFGFVSFVGVSA